MDSINDYLIKERLIESADSAAQDEKLECFYSRFCDLERKYCCVIDDMHQLELEHKEELSQLQDHIFKVKQLTEEREKLTLDYKDENAELKNKLKSLEHEMEVSLKTRKLMNDSSVLSDDDLSEGTVEILVYEGFGHIVSAPTHEKLAVLLQDRASKIEEIDELKKNLEELTQNQEREASSSPRDKLEESNLKIEALKLEIETLQSENEKMETKMVSLEKAKQALEEDSQENEVILSENIKLKSEINKLNADLDKISLSNLNNETETEEAIAKLEANKIEIGKLKNDNLNLKMEIDRLYDEIGSFESDNKHQREQIKSLKEQLVQAETDQFDKEANEKNVVEIKKLKLEIEDLNEELDELVQFKASYESLKLDYDKLNAHVQLNNSQGDLSATTPRKSNLTPNTSFRLKSQMDSPGQGEGKDKSKLELEWIKSENEKILLDLEKVQDKLDEKIESYNELKAQLAEKDIKMNEFISKYEKNQTDSQDLLNLQKKILELEHLLSNEKEERTLEIESNEERQKDLLKRNDSLWSQLTNMEQNYKDTVDIVRQQTERIQELESQLHEYDANNVSLDDQVKCEKSLNESLAKKSDDLSNKLAETLKELDDLKVSSEESNKSYAQQIDVKTSTIEELEKSVERLTGDVSDLNKVNSGLRQEIEALNKEKSFIIGQNESSHSKVMHDYLMLQEKHTDVSYQLNKASKEKAEDLSVIKGLKEDMMRAQGEKARLEEILKEEYKEKADLVEKNNYLETVSKKNVDMINELSDKLNKLEVQKSKLELKAKELETMEIKCDQVYNELNEKRETLSQVLEKNGKLEGQINQIECRLNEAKHSLINSEKTISELQQIKEQSTQKTEANITLKYECDNERSRREKAEKKVEELREDLRQMKQKMGKVQEEATSLRNENIEFKNQLDGVKSKIHMIADKNHSEAEKNQTLQDELSDLRKKLELTEVKCANYSDKFDLLLKKYDTRKIRQKNKVERLWEHLQRERAKYKNLLANAQNDLANTKLILDKENESKSKKDAANDHLIEENSKLVATVTERESKMRDMKRLNLNLQTKIKLLEEEIETLHGRVESTVKERNRYRKEMQLNLLNPVSSNGSGNDLISSTQSMGSAYSPTRDNINSINLIRNNVQLDSYEPRVFNSNSMITSSKYWNDLTSGVNSSHNATWDVNYNTGYLSRYPAFLESKPSYNSMTSNVMNINALVKGGSAKNSCADLNNYGGSVATDLNSSSSTPRSFK